MHNDWKRQATAFAIWLDEKSAGRNRSFRNSRKQYDNDAFIATAVLEDSQRTSAFPILITDRAVIRRCPDLNLLEIRIFGGHTCQ